MSRQQLRTKVEIVLIVIAVLALASLLLANLLPDQTYTAIRWVRNLATGHLGLPPDQMEPPPDRIELRPASFVLLPESAAREISRLCSRRGPKVVGTWQVSGDDIALLESHLSGISKLPTTSSVRDIRIAHPEACYRQYVGVIVGRRKLIYVNAFCGIELELNYWRSHFVNICDGGDSVWGVLYDPISQDFSELTTNGIA